MTVKDIIKSRKMRSFLMNNLGFIPDKLYVSLFYFAATGKWPDLKNPTGYNEKLQWIKLHDKDKNPEHKVLVDKLLVRDVIREKIGDGYSFPLLGYWEKFEEIDFDFLPNEFVLKCNHDSGSVKLIRDKSALTESDFEELKTFYNKRLKYDFYEAGREYPYKGIKPYIMAEKMMSDIADESKGVKDYKFYCFNGEPKLMLCVSGRYTEKHKDYFDMNYNRLPIRRGGTESEQIPPKPDCFEEMKTLAATLSEGLRQVRIDLYEINGKVYFGEYTFFSGGGFELFQPEEWERQLGDWIDLN